MPLCADIRDLITLDDVMEEMQYGPNGGLVFCMECATCTSFARVLTILAARFLVNNMDWLEEELGDYQDDYLIFDCPGTSAIVARDMP